MKDVDLGGSLLTPSSPFADFETNAGTYGYLSHESSIGPQQMSGYAQAVSDGGGGTVGSSVFDVDFEVDASAEFTLTGWAKATSGSPSVPIPGNAGVSLLADGSEVFGQAAVGDLDVSGTLEPGVLYTLHIFAQTTGERFDYATWGFTLAVPEPMAPALIAVALLGLGLRAVVSGRVARPGTAGR